MKREGSLNHYYELYRLNLCLEITVPLISNTNTNTNTNNFILHRIKNNKTLATSYFSMVNMYNIIQLFTIKLT